MAAVCRGRNKAAISVAQSLVQYAVCEQCVGNVGFPPLLRRAFGEVAQSAWIDQTHMQSVVALQPVQLWPDYGEAIIDEKSGVPAYLDTKKPLWNKDDKANCGFHQNLQDAVLSFFDSSGTKLAVWTTEQ